MNARSAVAMRRAVVRTFYPADPVGIVPGGVDTFIRGIVKWAPDDLDFEVVGMTTDPAARPLGRWTVCDLGRRAFRFFPAVTVRDAGARTRVPLSVRYTWAVARQGAELRRDFDVFEFHRIEPALMFLRDARPKNAFFHQDMGVIRTESKADILWRRMPWLYFRLEHRVVASLASAWCVREEGVRALAERNPLQAANLRFVPTWVDTEVFGPISEGERAAARQDLARAHGLDASLPWIVSVGRLDSQKNPQLLLDAVSRLQAQGRQVCWLVIGDGVLRTELEAAVHARGLRSRVAFLGLQGPRQIARTLPACDLYALSSAYEGMPMALLEALACGLPVVSTDVGEVARVVQTGVNGERVSDHGTEAFAAALERAIVRAAAYRGEPALRAVQAYQPQTVLAGVYENYRRLAASGALNPARPASAIGR